MVQIITTRENEIIEKKIKGISLSQNESNILSKTVRPKLIEIKKINAESILNKIEYNQKSKSIEDKIKKIVLENIDGVKAIIVCGSAIQTNYKEYNDIDVIVVTKKILTENKMEKKRLIWKIEDIAKKEGLILDIQIYAEESILLQYPHSPSLIYQLKDSKVIYGKIKIPNEINLSSMDLRMKLDWSDIVDAYSTSNEIYHALRNIMLVLLLMNKRVDNYELSNGLINLFGADFVSRLKNNKASKGERKIALNYIRNMSYYLSDELRTDKKWGKIEISNQ